MLVSVCFHNLVTYAQRLQDLYSAKILVKHTGSTLYGLASNGYFPLLLYASNIGFLRVLESQKEQQRNPNKKMGRRGAGQKIL
jgi:hypothetical protein